LVRVGITQFGTKASLVLSLTGAPTDVFSAIQKLAQIKGTTAIGSGLTVGQQDIAAYGRSNVPHAILMLTNGNRNEGPDPGPIADSIKLANTSIFVVAIGEVYLPPVSALASSPSDVFVTDFGSSLDGPLFDISSSICGPTAPCAGAIDVELVLDGSGSINSSSWQLLLSFSRDLVNSFVVSSSLAKFGIVQFSDTAQQELILSADKNAILTKLQNMKQIAGGTYLGYGIGAGQTDIDSNGRQNVAHAMIIMTDGDSSGDPVSYATKAKNAGIILFCVGVGTGINLTQLNAVASLPLTDHVFLATDFGTLKSIEERIAEASCPN